MVIPTVNPIVKEQRYAKAFRGFNEVQFELDKDLPRCEQHPRLPRLSLIPRLARICMYHGREGRNVIEGRPSPCRSTDVSALHSSLSPMFP